MSNVARRPQVLAKIALTGALAGALFGVAGCHWLMWSAEHDEEDFEFCDDAYAHCLEWAVSAQEVEWCEDDVMTCYDACEGTWEEEEDDGADETGGGNATGGDGNDGDGDSDGGDEDVCIELFGNCIDGAETIQDVEACEALYDQCMNPGECPLPECGGCPADELAICLDNYAECATLADTPEKVELCAEGFDACTGAFAEECAVEENPNLEPCLDQHALCVACADGDEQLAACEDVFESCMVTNPDGSTDPSSP
jgi:hypothetical protein